MKYALNEKDRSRLEDIEQRIRDMSSQLGYCREEYLQRERVLISALEELRKDRKKQLEVFADEYLKGHERHEWQYNADTKQFEKIPKS